MIYCIIFHGYQSNTPIFIHLSYVPSIQYFKTLYTVHVIFIHALLMILRKALLVKCVSCPFSKYLTPIYTYFKRLQSFIKCETDTPKMITIKYGTSILNIMIIKYTRDIYNTINVKMLKETDDRRKLKCFCEVQI